jgi:hypothetical protein
MYALAFEVKSSACYSKFITSEAFGNEILATKWRWQLNVLPVQWTSPRHIGEKHYDTADCRKCALRRELKMNYIFIVLHGKVDAAMGHSSAY